MTSESVPAPFDRDGLTGEYGVLPRPHVLLVEDDPDILDALTFALDDNYRVTAANDGVEAMLLLGSRRFDLIVLDLYLPGVDGQSILTSLRAKDVRTPVILASASKRVEKTALAFGIAGFLMKPFSLGRLEAMIESAIAAVNAADVEKMDT